MPKLPAVKDKDLIRALKELGFFEHRHRATSHLVMKHHDGRRAVVAMHSGKDIPHGTLRAILRDIQISTEQLLEVLKK